MAEHLPQGAELAGCSILRVPTDPSSSMTVIEEDQFASGGPRNLGYVRNNPYAIVDNLFLGDLDTAGDGARAFEQ